MVMSEAEALTGGGKLHKFVQQEILGRAIAGPAFG
jgi:hypothetical protein